MKPYKTPSGPASAQFIEKKSRFVGNIYPVETAEQAQEILKGMQKQFWDASHNVYAYILESGVMRFSDDGEPQGTAGMPTLEVLRREEVANVLCVTTRYFGGVLLGAGGLVRAYAHACKIALDAAGISLMTPYASVRLACPYPLLEQVRRLYGHLEAGEAEARYADVVHLELALPEENLPRLEAALTELSAGRLAAQPAGTRLFPKPVRPPVEST